LQCFERHAKENVKRQQKIRHGQADNVPKRKRQNLLLQRPASPTGQLTYVKGKVHTRTGHEGAEGEQMYSSTLPSTSALVGGG